MSGSARKKRSKFWVLRSWRAAQAGQKGGWAGGDAYPWERGECRGVYLGHAIRPRVSPVSPMSPVVLLSASRADISKDRGSNLDQVKENEKVKRNSKKLKFWKFKILIASVTATSCSHMLHYIKLCLWGAAIRLMLSLNLIMLTVALWLATRAAMPKDRDSNLGPRSKSLRKTKSIFDKLHLKASRVDGSGRSVVNW